jgi:hypothetical protein
MILAQTSAYGKIQFALNSGAWLGTATSLPAHTVNDAQFPSMLTNSAMPVLAAIRLLEPRFVRRTKVDARFETQASKVALPHQDRGFVKPPIAET